jgi:hypothetical protein
MALSVILRSYNFMTIYIYIYIYDEKGINYNLTKNESCF